MNIELAHADIFLFLILGWIALITGYGLRCIEDRICRASKTILIKRRGINGNN